MLDWKCLQRSFLLLFVFLLRVGPHVERVCTHLKLGNLALSRCVYVCVVVECMYTCKTGISCNKPLCLCLCFCCCKGYVHM